MKFLVDACAGHSLAEWLRLQGYDVVEVRDRDSKMRDEDILAWAVSEKRILVTMDKDFSELVTIQAKKHTGIIRLENLPLKIRVQHLAKILEFHAKDLTQKALIIQKISYFLSMGIKERVYP